MLSALGGPSPSTPLRLIAMYGPPMLEVDIFYLLTRYLYEVPRISCGTVLGRCGRTLQVAVQRVYYSYKLSSEASRKHKLRYYQYRVCSELRAPEYLTRQTFRLSGTGRSCRKV